MEFRFPKGHKINLGRKNHLNKHHSKETKERLRLMHLGKKHTEESKKKMSISRLGEKNHFYGKHHTEISINKIKEARANQIPPITPIQDTSIEVKIQNFLKNMNIEFLLHQYMKGINYPYRCDIFIPSMNLVIECDGNYWHSYPIGNPIDIIRSNELRDKGFKVLRLWESEINAIEPEEFEQLLNKVNPNLPKQTQGGY